jgi:hypothetical protein
MKKKSDEKNFSKVQEIINMSGSELLFCIKRLGINQLQYGLMLNPPITTAGGLNHYRSSKKLSYRLFKPLIDNYDLDLILEYLNKKRLTNEYY